MSITLTIVLEDEDIQAFVDSYNRDAESPITVDMVNQNEALHEGIINDMYGFWAEEVVEQSALDLYEDYFLSNEDL